MATWVQEGDTLGLCSAEAFTHTRPPCARQPPGSDRTPALSSGAGLVVNAAGDQGPAVEWTLARICGASDSGLDPASSAGGGSVSRNCAVSRLTDDSGCGPDTEQPTPDPDPVPLRRWCWFSSINL